MPPHATRPTANSPTDPGRLAEELVARWLIEQGWGILHRRWRCRWGELDLVALRQSGDRSSLVFVEVKARRDRNWDADGLLSITPQKQAKLWKAAELFLATFPQMAEFPSRFDVALVRTQSAPPGQGAAESQQTEVQRVQIGKKVAIADHHFTLQHYIPNAFSLVD